MYASMLGAFETSVIMSVAIVFLIVSSKLFKNKITASERHVLWIFIAVALLVPFRPSAFTISIPLWNNSYIAAHSVNNTQNVLPDYQVTCAVGGVDHIQIITVGLFALWIGGATIFALVWVMRHLRFVFRVKRLWVQIDDENILSMMTQIRSRVGILQDVRLMTCDVIPSPMIMGVFKPIIILPGHIITDDESRLRLMLFHEAVHIKRRDIIFRFICLVTLAVHWFNPLVHLMLRIVSEECEQATDNAVLEYLSEDSRWQYSETLIYIATAGWKLKNSTSPSLACNLLGRGKKLQRRLENITSNNQSARWVASSCMAVLLITVLFFSLISLDMAQAAEEYMSAGCEREFSGASYYENALPRTLNCFIEEAVEAYMAANPGVSIELHSVERESEGAQINQANYSDALMIVMNRIY